MNFLCRFSTAAIAASACIVMTSLSPAFALDNGRQVLVAGNGQGEGATQWAGPGMSNVFGDNYPGTGQGEQAASVRMPAGSLTNLRVNVVTENAPASGTFRVRLRVSGVDTVLTCAVSGTDHCVKTNTVNITSHDTIVLKVSNTFVGSGSVAWTASMEFD